MYCTQDDILTRIDEAALIELTNADPDATTVDSAKIAQAIAEADSTIDSYAAKRYTVPFDPVPAYIKNLSMDIAVYNLYTLKPTTFEENASVKDKFTNAIKFLVLLAKGEVTIGSIPEPSASPLTGGSFTANRRVFSRRTMRGF